MAKGMEGWNVLRVMRLLRAMSVVFDYGNGRARQLKNDLLKLN